MPWGLRKLLGWIHERYQAPEIFITENGCAMPDQCVGGTVADPDRITFLNGYIGAVHEALAAGIDVKGYFVWSFMDNFEWAEGFSKRFGMTYVDYATGQRIPKKSAQWYANTIKNNGLK